MPFSWIQDSFHLKGRASRSTMSAIICFFVLHLLAWSMVSAYERRGHCLRSIMNIGAVLDLDLQMGKQQKIAREITLQEFNHLRRSKLVLKKKNSHENSTQAIADATDLAQSKQVIAIIGTITHEEVTLASEITNSIKNIPILSLTSPAATELFSPQFPYFIQMSDDINLHMQCIADIVGELIWQKMTPSILRSYDATWTITQAAKKRVRFSQEEFSEMILSNNFEGLGGKTSSRKGKLQVSPTFNIINGESYTELAFWPPFVGFSKNLFRHQLMEMKVENGSSGVLGGLYWPGGLLSVPDGWTNSNEARTLKIGVPAKGAFNHFVDVTYDHRGNETPITGFSIDVFKAAIKRSSYRLPYDFVPFSGSYDKLVEQVYEKKFDGAVGDTEIMAYRYRHFVEFTQPYIEPTASFSPSDSKEKKGTSLFIQSFRGLFYICGSVAALPLLYVIICSIGKKVKRWGTTFLDWSCSKLKLSRRMSPVTDTRNNVVETTSNNRDQNPAVVEIVDVVMVAHAP